MMGVHQTQNDLFSYSVQLDKRVRPDHPLRQIAALIDFSFARAQTARFYGQNGNVSIDPAVILKLMFLLFYDNVASERELMGMVAERLDYLWFLGYGLDDEVPNHRRVKQGAGPLGQGGLRDLSLCVWSAVRGKGFGGREKIHIDFQPDRRRRLERLRPQRAARTHRRPQASLSRRRRANSPTPRRRRDMSRSTTAWSVRLIRTRPSCAKAPTRPRPRYHHHRVVDDGRGVVTAIQNDPRQHRRAESTANPGGSTPSPHRTLRGHRRCRP